ncbi:hypothetical protein FACS1894186_2640 [Alphaproteobacteria bacterium]|nr:hypothetical protein FACS1894186_2640 [Alphaproteobacteria bacterium]
MGVKGRGQFIENIAKPGSDCGLTAEEKRLALLRLKYECGVANLPETLEMSLHTLDLSRKNVGFCYYFSR